MHDPKKVRHQQGCNPPAELQRTKLWMNGTNDHQSVILYARVAHRGQACSLCLSLSFSLGRRSLARLSQIRVIGFLKSRYGPMPSNHSFPSVGSAEKDPLWRLCSLCFFANRLAAAKSMSEIGLIVFFRRKAHCSLQKVKERLA